MHFQPTDRPAVSPWKTLRPGRLGQPDETDMGSLTLEGHEPPLSAVFLIRKHSL